MKATAIPFGPKAQPVLFTAVHVARAGSGPGGGGRAGAGTLAAGPARAARGGPRAGGAGGVELRVAIGPGIPADGRDGAGQARPAGEERKGVWAGGPVEPLRSGPAGRRTAAREKLPMEAAVTPCPSPGGGGEKGGKGLVLVARRLAFLALDRAGPVPAGLGEAGERPRRAAARPAYRGGGGVEAVAAGAAPAAGDEPLPVGHVDLLLREAGFGLLAAGSGGRAGDSICVDSLFDGALHVSVSQEFARIAHQVSKSPSHRPIRVPAPPASSRIADRGSN